MSFRLTLQITLLLAIPCLSFLEEYKHKNGVINLTPKILKDIIKRYDYTLVEFSVKTCKQCNQLTSILSRLNTAFHEQLDFPLPVTRIQCEEGQNVTYCEKIENIKAYPTLRLYQNDKKIYSQYVGQIGLNNVARWINDRINNNFIRLYKNSEKEFNHINEFQEIDGIQVFIYFGKPDTENWKIMRNFAFMHTHSAFYWSDDLKVLEKYDPPLENLAKAIQNGLIFTLKPHDERLALFDKRMNFDNQEDFYTENREAVMNKFDLKFLKSLKKRNDRPILILISSNKDEELIEEYLHVAHAYKSKEEVYFTHIDLKAKNNHPKALEVIEKSLGVHLEDMPTLRAINPDKKLINYHQTSFSSSIINRHTMKSFVRSLIRDEVKPHKKSQQFMKNDDKEKNQDIVVRDNFRHEVIEDELDVILFTMADHSYCINCKGVEEVLIRIQEEFKGKVKILKFDIYRNEQDDWMFGMAPELVYFNKDMTFVKNQPSFDSGFNFENIKDWIQKNYQDKLSVKMEL